MSKCCICQCGFDAKNEEIHICEDSTTHGGCHIECFKSYFEYVVGTQFSGICLAMYCPSQHTDENKRILHYSRWSSVVNADLLTRHSFLANSTLQLMCSICHVFGSIAVPVSTQSLDDAKLAISTESPKLLSCIHAYECGNISIDAVYEIICQYYNSILQSVADGAAWDTFSGVLRAIEDPERRANLQLRYLRDRPQCWSQCCNQDHCFKCQSSGFHTGESCASCSDSQDLVILNCPKCDIALVKTGGCDNVTCVCGKSFDWSLQLDKASASTFFANAFPMDTAQACVDVLTGSRAGDETQALAWRSCHELAVNILLLKLFESTFKMCPSRCCMLPQCMRGAGWALAAELYAKNHTREVEKCRTEHAFTMFQLFQAKQAQELINDGPAGRPLRSASQFLQIYGHQQYNPMKLSLNSLWRCHDPMVRTLNDLIFTCDHGTGVAISQLSYSHSRFSALVVTGQYSAVISLGVKENKPTQRLFGVTNARWENHPYSSSCLRCHDEIFQPGVVIVCEVNLDKGQLVIAVNHTIVELISFPRGKFSDYFFIISIAGDSGGGAVQLVNDDEQRNVGLAINSDHFEMYHNFKQHLIDICVNWQSMNGIIENDCALAWEGLVGGEQQALSAFERFRPAIEEVLGRSLIQVPNAPALEPSTSLNTWNNMLNALCWYMKHKLTVENNKYMSLANSFRSTCSDNSCARAAQLLYNPSNDCNCEQLAQARAFMKMFPDEMNAWYNNVTVCGDTLCVKDMVQECTCLPRHFANTAMECPSFSMNYMGLFGEDM